MKIEHKEHERVDEMGNAEKAMCLHFGGLQADGAGLGGGSLGFPSPKVYLGLPSGRGLWITITPPVQGYSPAAHAVHISTRALPWGHSLAVELAPTSPDAGGFACCRGRHQPAPRLTPAQATEMPTALPLRSSSCCTYFLQSWVTGYKVQRQCSGRCGTLDEAFQTSILHWQAVQINGNLKNLTENVLCRISAHSAQPVKISFLPLPCWVLCPQCNVSSACIWAEHPFNTKPFFQLLLFTRAPEATQMKVVHHICRLWSDIFSVSREEGCDSVAWAQVSGDIQTRTTLQKGITKRIKEI